MAETMDIWRIFTRPDGTSSMERVQLGMGASGNGTVSKLLAGPGVMIRHMPVHLDGSWHTAPRRQMIATIQGEAELETGDGQVLQMHPGIVTVVEDVTGIGHITRVKKERVCLFLPLDDETKLE